MPNGGSDCCGTCWFNSSHKGRAGYIRLGGAANDCYCTIRQLAIRVEFYTYCANHPYRNPERIEIPLGPVWEGTSAGFREVWKLAPDTESGRLSAIALLAAIREQPQPEYPIGACADEIAVWQLGEWREARALPELRRIAQFSPEVRSDDVFARSRASTVAFARQAIAKIEGTMPLEYPQEPPERPHPIKRLRDE